MEDACYMGIITYNLYLFSSNKTICIKTFNITSRSCLQCLLKNGCQEPRKTNWDSQWNKKNPFDETDFDFLAISEQKSQKLGLEFEFK